MGALRTRLPTARRRVDRLGKQREMPPLSFFVRPGLRETFNSYLH